MMMMMRLLLLLPSRPRALALAPPFKTVPLEGGQQRLGGSTLVRPQREQSPLSKVLPLKKLKTPRENIYTIPNWLTASRLVAAPFIGYCILHDHHAWALGLFAYAGITDALDGWIARRWDLKTVVGTVIDPMADKTLMTVLTVALAAKGALPVWLAVIILGRDVALGISAIYYRWISLPPPKTFARYWDFSLPSAEVRPTTISKYNTFLQLGLMGLTTVAPVLPGLELGTPLMVMQYVVAATTIWSGASYVYSKDAVKILSHQQEVKQEKRQEAEDSEKKKKKKKP
ncbi:putative cardiolipin synthase [Diplogelasinospora grovesii]|uniref:Cardiolipin synthase n=1 Tax=Diplogelasinospora grovesii TaxID=303347 RepID=A0AAN6S880_9PEZI|nr:putative cardiolipin synthase [Diplogelasinospora grovesii]